MSELEIGSWSEMESYSKREEENEGCVRVKIRRKASLEDGDMKMRVKKIIGKDLNNLFSCHIWCKSSIKYEESQPVYVNNIRGKKWR